MTASFTQSDRGVSGDGHAPDVALLDVLRQQHLAGVDVDDVGDAVLGDLERLVVRLYSSALACQADVGAQVPMVVGSNWPLVL